MGCGSASHFSGPTRSMQRPGTVKTGSSIAVAAKLERRKEEEDDLKREEWKT